MIVMPQLYPVFKTIREIENPIVSRLGYFCLTPLITIAAAADSLIGAGACVATIATLGKVQRISDFAFEQSEKSAELGADSFYALSRVIKGPKFNPSEKQQAPLITTALKKWFGKKMESQNLFILRVGLVAFLPALLVSRIADLAWGIITGIGSLFFFRENKDLWLHSFNQLRSFNVFGDITFCVLKIINPNTKVSYNY